MSKQYSTQILDRSDDEEVAELMEKNPLWSKKVARDTVARRKFQRRIDAAGMKVNFVVSDHKHEAGYMGVCERCGLEKKNHARR